MHDPKGWTTTHCYQVSSPLGQPHGDRTSQDRALLGGQGITAGSTPSSSGNGEEMCHLGEATGPHIPVVTCPSGPFSCGCHPLDRVR